MGKQSGLTLIELMVVVAILAILSAVAYPIYTEQVRKSRRTDARTALEVIAQAEERYFSVNGAYTADLGLLDVDSVVGSDCSGSSCDTVKGYYTVSVASTGAARFTVTATPKGGQASDSCTSLTLNQLGVQGGSGSGCW